VAPVSIASDHRRFYFLDGLRLVAAVAVLAYHYTAINKAPWQPDAAHQFPVLSNITSYGALGVQLFFVISGFVILLSAYGRSVGDFVASRVSRLYPAYWASVIAAFVLFRFLQPNSGHDDSITGFLVNMTMIQEGMNVDHLDGVYWTLWIELLFYVLIAIFLAIGLTEQRVMAFILLWPLVAAVAKTSNSKILINFLSPDYAPLFCAGMALFLIHKFGHSLLRWGLFTFNVFIGTYFANANFVLKSMSYNTGRDLSPVVGGAIMIGIFAVVALVTVTPWAYKGPRWLTVAGALTFPLYLFHEAWGWWIISLFSGQMSKWGVLAIAVAFSFVVAFLVERWVERPLRPLISRALRNTFSDVSKRSENSSA